ncbi:TonB-dependent receptor plug domain-containing protein [Sphingomonas sp. ID0503]|uniref:TonB-dependent receptor plug domain-containing protein n=1 Tax=Sphingomonas sp. ID0503 TaxID=3399691 RepID=UPI003AFAE722
MLKFGSASLIALAIASPAFAQSSDDDIVVTATGIAQSIDEVGQAITVLDANTINTRQNINVADLLLTTPGVRFNRSGSNGAVGLSLRGAEVTQTLVLIDGVKVNDPSGIGDQFDFGNLLIGNLRRVEVLRGSNSLPYGSQAIGGVVNVMTATPPTDGLAADASAEYGYSDTVNAKADVSGGSGIVSGGAGIAYFDTDGISTASSRRGATEKDGYKNITANARLKVAFTQDLSLDLRGYYIHGDLDYDSFFGAPADSTDVSKSDQYVGYAGINAAFLDGRFSNRLAVTYYKQNRDYYSVRGTAADYGYKGENVRFEYQGVFQPIDRAKLIFGYEHEKPEYDFFGFGSTASESADLDSVYGLAVVEPLDGLSITGGARYTDHSQFGGKTTLGANANYTPNGGDTNLRVAYGEGFKAPSLYQLYDSFSGNPDLVPEKSKSYDVGFDQSALEGRATLSVTAFRRVTRDQINYDVTLPPFGGYNNIEKTKTKGVEAAVALRPVDALTVTTSYSYINARDRSPGANYGNRLARRAANVLSVSADYDWSFGLKTGGTVTMVSDSFNDPANTRELDGYALVALRASLPVGEHLELYGRVENLADAHYETVYGYGSYGRSAYAGVRVKL